MTRIALLAAFCLVAATAARADGPAVTTIPLSQLAGPVTAAIKASGFSGMNLSGALVNGTALSAVASQAAAGATAAPLANAALPSASLPSTTIRANFDDVARSLADRMSDRLNVKAFGAKGDGTTDDTLAFQNAAAVATGHIPTHIGAGLSAYLAALTKFVGVGVFSNGAVEIDVPAGHYILTAPIPVAYQANSAIHWKGDGSSMTELEFKGGVDGIVTTFSAANGTYGNEAARQGNWQGQGIEIEGIHFVANTGIVPLVPGNTNIGTGQGESGTAIKTIAFPLINASMPPFQIYHDLLFGNSGGWSDAANNWKGALYLQDPDNLFVDKVMFIDHSLDNNRTSTPIWVHSTAPAGGPGHGFLNFFDTLIWGGSTCLLMDGDAIQGVNIRNLATLACQDGVSWTPPANSLSGSIVIADSSMGADRYIVHLANIGTVFSHDNFYYNTSPPKLTDPIFFNVGGGDTIISHHDQFYGPLPGYEGTDSAGKVHQSAAMFVTGYGSADVTPSHISDDTISHFDNGLIYGGGSTMNFTNDVVASDTTTCYRDTSAATAPAMRAQFDGIYCGGGVNAHDGVGLTGAIDWAQQRYLNGALELGLPGITSPGGVTGYGGGIDFHSTASSNGALAGLNDYDVRLYASGGTAGTSGAGALVLNGTGGLNLLNGPLAATALNIGNDASTIAGDLSELGKLTATQMITASGGIQAAGASPLFSIAGNGAGFLQSLGIAGTLSASTIMPYGNGLPVSFPGTGGLAMTGGPLQLLPIKTAQLPTGCAQGYQYFAQDGRNPGEAAGAGTGVPVFCNSKTAWIAYTTGAAVTY